MKFDNKDISLIYDLLGYDKKNEGEKVNFVLLKEIGRPIIDQEVSEEVFRESFKFYNQSL